MLSSSGCINYGFEFNPPFSCIYLLFRSNFAFSKKREMVLEQMEVFKKQKRQNELLAEKFKFINIVKFTTFHKFTISQATLFSLIFTSTKIDRNDFATLCGNCFC